jgi:hypothetical protein
MDFDRIDNPSYPFIRLPRHLTLAKIPWPQGLMVERHILRHTRRNRSFQLLGRMLCSKLGKERP